MLRKIATSALVSVLWKCFALLTVFILVPPPIVAKECGNVSGSDTPTKTIRRTAPLIPGSNLIVTNPVGSIQLSGWEREQIIVEARIEGEKPDSVEIDFKKVNAGIEVVIKNISTRRLLGLMPPKKVKCDLIISVPRQILIRVKAINGQIKISDINGSTKCETVNGGIQMLNIFGDIDASTVNGSISLSKANLRPRIVIRRPPGQPPPPPPHTATIKLETVNGTIQMDEVVGGIVANTIHGAIRANMLFGLGKDINLESLFMVLSGQICCLVWGRIST